LREETGLLLSARGRNTLRGKRPTKKRKGGKGCQRGGGKGFKANEGERSDGSKKEGRNLKEEKGEGEEDFHKQQALTRYCQYEGKVRSEKGKFESQTLRSVIHTQTRNRWPRAKKRGKVGKKECERRVDAMTVFRCCALRPYWK